VRLAVVVVVDLDGEEFEYVLDGLRSREEERGWNHDGVREEIVTM